MNVDDEFGFSPFPSLFQPPRHRDAARGQRRQRAAAAAQAFARRAAAAAPGVAAAWGRHAAGAWGSPWKVQLLAIGGVEWVEYWLGNGQLCGK